MRPPVPTPIYRITHGANLWLFLERDFLHAPAGIPQDGLPYHAIHAPDVQASRLRRTVPAGSGGSFLDYVPFYFGTRSPMLLRIHTGHEVPERVDQRKIIYLVTTAQRVAEAGLSFVYFDGHALSALSRAFDDLAELRRVDWRAVSARQWSRSWEDPDRQRRKQAEFLVRNGLPWDLIQEIGVLDAGVARRVEEILDDFPGRHRPIVREQRGWCYESSRRAP